MEESGGKFWKGVIGGAVIAAVAYFFFLAGKKKEVGEQQNSVAEAYEKYRQRYGSRGGPRLRRISDLIDQRRRENEGLRETKKELEKEIAFRFPEWVDKNKVPEAQGRRWHDHFADTLVKKQHELEILCMARNVPWNYSKHLGFKEEQVREHDDKSAPDKLKQLAILEKIIMLAIEAKQAEKTETELRAKRSEAFLRFLNIIPEDPVEKGAVIREKRPDYDKKKHGDVLYVIKKLPAFIREFPVRIEMISDVNTFMRFLHAVRQKNQFLTVRTLQIISPSLKESVAASTCPKELEEEVARRQGAATTSELVWASVSAAGGEFFEPKAEEKETHEILAERAKKQVFDHPLGH